MKMSELSIKLKKRFLGLIDNKEVNKFNPERNK